MGYSPNEYQNKKAKDYLKQNVKQLRVCIQNVNDSTQAKAGAKHCFGHLILQNSDKVKIEYGNGGLNKVEVEDSSYHYYEQEFDFYDNTSLENVLDWAHQKWHYEQEYSLLYHNCFNFIHNIYNKYCKYTDSKKPNDLFENVKENTSVKTSTAIGGAAVAACTVVDAAIAIKAGATVAAAVTTGLEIGAVAGPIGMLAGAVGGYIFSKLV